jgi:hypothetical protein
VAKKIGARTVTVIRAPKVDRLSSEPAGPAPEHDIEGCAVMPRTSHEEERGWVIVEGRMVVAPHGSDILADDQVRVDNEVWDVDGEPGDYENKKAQGKATIFYLKRLGT